MGEGFPIVICCADDDRAAIEEATAPLTGEGHAITIVDGVVDDPKQLAPIIDALERQGLYVLCRSKGLGRTSIEELREILLAQQVPFSRTLTVAATRPALVTERIRGSLGRVSHAAAARATARPRATLPPRPKTKPAQTRAAIDDDPPTVELPAIKTPADAPSPVAGDDTASLHPADTATDAPAASVLPPRRPSMPPPPPPNEDSVVAPLPSSSSVDLTRGVDPLPGDDSMSNMVTSISDIDLSDLDYGDTNIGRAPEGPTEGTVRVSSTMTNRTGQTAIARIDGFGGDSVVDHPPGVDSLPARGLADPVVTRSALSSSPSSSPGLGGATSTPPAHSSPHMRASTPPPATAAAAPGPALGRGAWIAGIGGLAAVAVLAVVCTVGGSSDEGAGQDKANVVANADDNKSDDNKSDPKTNAADTRATDDSDSPTDGAAASVDDPVVDDAGSDAAAPVVLAAIVRRNIRALDTLLVQSKPGGILSWADAQSYCQGLTIDGLADWRLPALGELRSIAAARMLYGKVTYWSVTSADTFGDAHLAFQPKRWRVVDTAKTAQTLCVRGARADS